MIKNTIYLLLIIGVLPYSAIAQEEDNNKTQGRFFGGVESNSQYYVDDPKLGDFMF